MNDQTSLLPEDEPMDEQQAEPAEPARNKAPVIRRTFSEDQKIQMVKYALASDYSVFQCSKELDVAGSVLQRWVDNYQLHGTATPSRKKTKPKAKPKPKAKSTGSELVKRPVGRPRKVEARDPEEPQLDNTIVLNKFAELRNEIDRLTDERDALLTTLRMIMKAH